MWNNISEYAGARNGIADLNSAYYNLIENKTPAIFQRKDTGDQVLVETESNNPDTQETQSGYHGCLLSNSEYPRPSGLAPLSGNGHHSKHFLTRLKSKTTYTNFPKGSYSNLIASNLNVYGTRNGSVHGLNIANEQSSVESLTGLGNIRCHSQIRPAGHTTLLENDDFSPIRTQSDHTHNSKKLNPEVSFTRSTFDVEEDSQFQFYLEDMDSQGNVKKMVEVKSSNIPTSPSAIDTSNVEKINFEAAPESSKSAFTNEEPQVQRLESSQLDFQQLYSNPRYGERFAYKNGEIMSTVGTRTHLKKREKRQKSSELKLKSKSISSTEKFLRELRERRGKLKPSKKQKMKSMENIKPSFVPEIGLETTIGSKAKSTQFIVPPRLSESSVSSIGFARNVESNNDSSDEYEFPEPIPNINAIRDYNTLLEMGNKSKPLVTEKEPPAGAAQVHIRRIPKISSRILNIPKDSWMMLPIRLLPGAFVPYSALIYAPFIILVVILMAYFIALIL